MSFRGSGPSSSSSSEVNFDDLDDQQVFCFLEDTYGSRLPSPPIKPKGADFLPSSPYGSRVSHSYMAVDAPTSLVTQNITPITKPLKKSGKDIANCSLTTANFGSQTRNDSTKTDATIRKTPTVCCEDSKSKCRSASSCNDPVKAEEVNTASETEFAVSARYGNANVIAAELVSLQTQVELLTSEKLQMEGEVATTRRANQILEDKLIASEQSINIFGCQLESMKAEFKAKIMAREKEVSVEILSLRREKETQLQRQQARIAAESELWRQEVAALTKAKLDLENENRRLWKELNSEGLQRTLVESKHRTLETEYKCTCEELQTQQQERKRLKNSQGKIKNLRTRMTGDLNDRDFQYEHLQERLNNLALEKEDLLTRWERERKACSLKHELKTSKLLHFAQEVRQMHHSLQLSVVKTREIFMNEVRKTTDALGDIQQQASQFAVHQSDHEVALILGKGRIIQLETQLKKYRQTINQLKVTLASSTRSLDKKYAVIKKKCQEQKEHLDTTLAVRQGLIAELQAKKNQIAELERKVARLNAIREMTDTKLKHTQQQVLVMKEVHDRELEKLGIQPLVASRCKFFVQNNCKMLHDGSQDDSEWHEFVELVAAWEAERQLHADNVVNS